MKIASFFCMGLLVAACGGQVASQDDSGTTPAPDSSAPSTSGVVLHACGPTDGPAHQFSFGSPLTCGSPMIADDTLTITLDSQLTGPASINLAPGGHGTAEVCTFVGCQTASEGKLDVTVFDTSKNVASGSYTFTTPDAKVHTATFTNIPICANTIMCG